LRLIVGPVVLGKRAGRGALKLLKRPVRFEWRLVPKRGIRPDGVVIVAPERQLPAGVVQGIEDLLVQERGLRQQTHQIADWIGGMTFVPMSACPNLW